MFYQNTLRKAFGRNESVSSVVISKAPFTLAAKGKGSVKSQAKRSDLRKKSDLGYI